MSEPSYAGRNEIYITFHTLRDLSDPQDGIALFGLLDRFGFVPSKCGKHEPIRLPFSPQNRDLIQRLWLPSFVDSDFQASTILARGSLPLTFLVMVRWTKNNHPEATFFNYLSIWLSPKYAKGSRENLLEIGRALYEWAKPVYGAIATTRSWDAQWTRCYEEVEGDATVTITEGITPATQLGGIHWANFFGPPYISEIGLNKFEDAGVRYERLPDGGILLLTSDDPLDPQLEDPQSRVIRMVIERLGPEWFGEGSNPRVSQFDFSNLRRQGKMREAKRVNVEERNPPAEQEGWERNLQAKAGRRLTFALQDFNWLDQYIHERRFRPEDVTPLGWYVGEILQRSSSIGGRWVYDNQFKTWSTVGEGWQTFPMHKVEALVKIAPRDGLSFYYQALQRAIKKGDRDQGEVVTDESGTIIALIHPAESQ